MGPKFNRSRLLVDPPFQARLLLRVGVYFLLYVLIVWHVGFALEMIRNAADGGVRKSVADLYVDFLSHQMMLIYAMVFTAPTFLYNLLKFSHRVAGPLYRCRSVMTEMAAGKAVPEFKPRQGDLMRELFLAFNSLIAAWNAKIAAEDEKVITNQDAGPVGDAASNETSASVLA